MADNDYGPFKMFRDPEMFHGRDALDRAIEYARAGDHRQAKDWMKNAQCDLRPEEIRERLQKAVKDKRISHNQWQALTAFTEPAPPPPPPAVRAMVAEFRRKEWQNEVEKEEDAPFHTPLDSIGSNQRIVGDEATWKPVLEGKIVDEWVAAEDEYESRHHRYRMRLISIQGPRGTPTEQVGEAIYALGIRGHKPFEAIAHADTAPARIEEALFGREVATSGGPIAVREGAFERANGGVVLIPDVETLPRAVQIKLLQAVQQGKVTRVGGVKAIPVDVCVVVASSQPFEKVMSSVRVPPEVLQPPVGGRLVLASLNERLADICHKVYAYLEEYNEESGRPPVAGVDDEALGILIDHNWDGVNDAGLENELKDHAFPRAVGRALLRQDLSPEFLSPYPALASQDPRDEAIDLGCFLVRFLAAGDGRVEQIWASVQDEWEKLQVKWQAMQKECSIKEVNDYSWFMVRYNDVWRAATNVRPYRSHKKAAGGFIEELGGPRALSHIPDLCKRLQAIERLTATDFVTALEEIIAMAGPPPGP